MIKTNKGRNAGCRLCDKLIPKGTERFMDLFCYSKEYYHLNCYLKHLEKEIKEREDLVNYINLKFKNQLKEEIKRRIIEEL